MSEGLSIDRIQIDPGLIQFHLRIVRRRLDHRNLQMQMMPPVEIRECLRYIVALEELIQNAVQAAYEEVLGLPPEES